MAIDFILEKKLTRRNDLRTLAWDAWEHKSSNTHRGVLFQQSNETGRTYSDMEKEIREQVRSVFDGSWWRGFGFGVVIELPKFPDDVKDMVRSIDSRARRGGAWQWTILADRQNKSAVGVHMWMEGYLTPVFSDLLEHYQSEGFRVSRSTKEADGLMKFLKTAHRWLHGGFVIDIVKSAQAEDPPQSKKPYADR